MAKANLYLLEKVEGIYRWDCPSCNNGSFSWSDSINSRWGHPPDKAYCGVCNTYHDIEKREHDGKN